MVNVKNIRLGVARKRALIILLGLALIVLGVGLANQAKNDNKTVASIDNSKFVLEQVDTPEGLQQGLGGRGYMPNDHGMLFIFPESNQRCMWMKNMRFALDILWVEDNGTIVDIEDNIDPSTYPESFCGSKPVRYVIELNAGQSSANGINIGSTVDLP